MTIPRISDIFDTLSRGHFISANNVEIEKRDLFQIVEENFEELHNYFKTINFTLERGDNYFYFSRPETKTTLENKIVQAYKWIDILDFLKTFNSSFCAGFRFTPDDLVQESKVNTSLKDKFQELKKHTGSKSESNLDQARALCQMMRKEGVADLENNETETYKVTSAFGYLENLVLAINVYDEDEI